MHQVYPCQVKPLWPKGHLNRGRSVPGTVRQPDLEFLEHLLAHRSSGQCPTGPSAARGGLDHLHSKLYLPLDPCRGDVQGNLLDWQGPHLGVAYLQLCHQLWLTAKLGACVGQVQGVDGMLLIVQVTDF